MSEDPHIISSLIDLCRSMRIQCIVQVGAAEGDEVARIQEAIGCHAVAIEARPEVLPASFNIDFHYTVIGATDGVTEFYVHPSGELSGHFPRVDGGEEKITEKQQRLDTFCFNNRLLPDALIIDTEGTTLEVLEGAGRVLDTVRLIYAECQTVKSHPDMRLLKEVDDFLVDRGFVRREGLPAYSVGAQGNYCWVKT